ncbi:hypothetical protein [Pengzhenrongella sp.]|jgi:hypothetical protein|uniref:hypothetical protein n=1 Tax=Pengzhenrongella sp. TaxID=2888820 RepID=UPI002F944018
MNEGLPTAVAELAEWSGWKPFDTVTVRSAPTTPGVYLFKQESALVYVGRAGERGGKGLRGRLTIYVSGRAPHSGLGNLAFERALQDSDWLRSRLAELEAGNCRTVQEWSVLAVQRAQLDICWSSSLAADDAVALERAVLDALRDEALWNRLR